MEVSVPEKDLQCLVPKYFREIERYSRRFRCARKFSFSRKQATHAAFEARDSSVLMKRFVATLSIVSAYHRLPPLSVEFLRQIPLFEATSAFVAATSAVFVVASRRHSSPMLARRLRRHRS